VLFEQRTFTVAKDAARPQENQDAAAADPARGIAALADGAASSLQSGRWARLLVEAIVAEPPNVRDAAVFAPWLAARREAWLAGIDQNALAWHQKARLADGAFATLVWLQVVATGKGVALRAFALGDACLLHIRSGRVRRSFPIEESSLFGTEPALVGSAPRQAAGSLAFHTLEDTCEPGDLLVLASDAVAAWSLGQLESRQPLGLESLWDMSQEDYERWIDRLRSQQVIRYDDSTVVLIQISNRRSDHESSQHFPSQLSRWAKRLWK
jgi:hypothetical protein